MLDHNFDYQIKENLEELELYIHHSANDGHFIPHHIFGHPDAVQGSVRIFWASKFLNPSDKYFQEIDKNLKKYQEQGNEFELLLQIDLEDCRISIPNYGNNCLYFGILKEDLIAENFDRVQLVIQST